MRMRDTSINRNVSFSILGGDLIRTVAAQGRPDIVQRCDRQTFEAVVWAAEYVSCKYSPGISVREIASTYHLRHTRVAVAMEFMEDRGIIHSFIHSGGGDTRPLEVSTLMR